MADTDRSFEVLRAVGDLGRRQPAASDLSTRVNAAVEREIELELLGTERNAAGLRKRWRWWQGRRSGFGALAVASSVAVAVAIAVVFLAVGSHSPRVRPAHRPAYSVGGAAPGEFIWPLGAVPSLQQLRANFAVLRRPQTTADRSWKPPCGCEPAARQLNGLTRLAARLPGGYRVFLDVEQFIYGGQLNQAAGTYVLNLDIVNRRGDSTSESFAPNVGYAVSPLNSGGPRALRGHRTASQIFASVVPDGVSTVSWTFGCPHSRASASRCAGVRTRTFTVGVVNNVAARSIPGIGNCMPCAFDTHVIWRSSDGQVAASFPRGFGNLAAPPFVAGERGGLLRVLEPDGIGDARFGERSSTATRTITRLLGSPADSNVATGGCGIDHETVWTSPGVAHPLTIFQRNGRFTGYQYGAPVTEIGLERGPGALLTTPSGSTLDETIAATRHLYPTGFSTRAAHGVGRWQAAAAGGTLYGFVLPTIYPLRTVTDQNPVATIDAGQTGCTPSAGQ